MSISPINLDIIANAKGVKSGVAEANKELDKVGQGNTLAAGADKATAAYKKTAAEIKKTVAELYKLQNTVGKGGSDSTALLKQIEALKSSLSGADVGAQKKRGELIKELGKEALKFAGIGGVNEKVIGTSLGGINLGSVAGGIGVALAAGQAGANVRQSQRDSGVSGSGFGNFVGGVQSLPVIKQLSEAAGEFGALFGLKTSTSDNAAELDRLNQAAAIYDDLRKSARNAAKENAVIDRENARTLTMMNQGTAALSVGGKLGKQISIENNANNAIADAKARRDATPIQVAEQKSALAATFAERSKQLTATASGRSGPEADAAKKELDNLRSERDRVMQLLSDREANAGRAFEEQKAAIVKNAQTQISILNGTLPDLKAQDDAYEALGDSIATLSKSPFEQLKKQFAGLNPDQGSQKVYDQRVDEYEKKMKAIKAELEAEQTALAVEDELRNINAQTQIEKAGTDKDRIAIEVNAMKGLTDEQRKQLIAAREKLAIAKQEADVQKSIASANVNAAVARETDPLKKIELQVRAMKELTKAQQDQLILAKQAEALAQEGASFKESLKEPKDRLRDSIDQVKRLLSAGEITDDQAMKGIEKARNDFIDSQKTSNPALLEAGSGAAQRAAYIASGRAVDASNPMVREQKKTNELLSDIKNGKTSAQIADDI